MASDSMDTYWAAEPTSLIGDKIYEKVSQANANRLTSTITSRLRRAYQYAYGLDEAGTHAASMVLRGGEAGELTLVKVNHARALVNTLSNLVSAPKVVWEPKATNLDYDSLKETDLARAVLEYYWQEKAVSRHAVAALDGALFFAEYFVLLDWDDEAGQDYAAVPDESAAPPTEPPPDTFSADLSADPSAPPAPPPEFPTKMMKSGDVVFRNVAPWDVIRDPNKTSWEANDWVIVTVPINRWDLVAQYPEMKDEILAVAPGERLGIPINGTLPQDTDDVLLCRFYHKRTPALPNGREVLLLSSKAVLIDRELRFDELPLYRMSAGEQAGTSFGYSAFFDTLGVQELMDSLQSVAASNQSTFAGQTISASDQSEIQPQDVGGGMRVIYTPDGSKDPKALELCKTPAELFSHLGNLKADQRLLMGISSVVQGEPPPGGLSGSALALLQSQALQQSSAVQANYLRLIEGLGTGLVKTIQKYASVPQKVALVGKSNAALVEEQEYTGKDLQRICRVQIQIGNPLAQTPTGRIEIAKELIGMKLIQTAEQYETVLATGRLEPLTQSLHHEMLLIRAENEQLSRAEDPVLCVLDMHPLHMREHKSLTSNPEIRKDPTRLAVVLKHIEEHKQAFASADPELLQMMGMPLPPPPPPMPGMGPPPPVSGMSGTPKPPMPGVSDKGGPGPDGNAPPMKPPGMTPGGRQPNLPNNPKNAATGQRFNPEPAPKTP